MITFITKKIITQPFIQCRKVPDGTTEIRIYDCPDLIELPELPSSIECIKIVACTNLKKLPKIPEGVIELHLKDCTALNEFPDLPNSLLYLNIKGCTKLLENNPEAKKKILAILERKKLTVVNKPDKCLEIGINGYKNEIYQPR